MAKIEIDTEKGTVVVDGVNFVPEAAASPAGDEVPADSAGDAAVETAEATAESTGDDAAEATGEGGDAGGDGGGADEAPAAGDPAPTATSEEPQT